MDDSADELNDGEICSYEYRSRPDKERNEKWQKQKDSM